MSATLILAQAIYCRLFHRSSTLCTLATSTLVLNHFNTFVDKTVFIRGRADMSHGILFPIREVENILQFIFDHSNDDLPSPQFEIISALWDISREISPKL